VLSGEQRAASQEHTIMLKLFAPPHVLIMALIAAVSLPASATGPVYVLENATTLPSTNSSWDYLSLDQAGGRLFIARRLDGLTVFDINTKTVLSTVENSKGANGALLLPEFNRVYTAMTDGTVLVVDLTTLKPIDRFKVDDGGLNAGFYEPTTKRVHMVVGSRPKTSTWITLDAATGIILGHTEFDSTKMDDPTVDGRGHIFAPTRDTNTMLKLNAADLTMLETWQLGACVQPVAVAFDHATNRLLIGCRGDKPVFIAVDASNGHIVATHPIGRGVDGLVMDEQTRVIVTVNGVDATMSVIQQEGPDTYRPLATISTRPMARVIAMDQNTHRVFTVTADVTVPVAGADGKAPAPVFHDHSFTVLTYAAR
jgi:DNA-binding beta-propeller fold protein YncE